MFWTYIQFTPPTPTPLGLCLQGYHRPRRRKAWTLILSRITPHYMLYTTFQCTPLHRNKGKTVTSTNVKGSWYYCTFLLYSWQFWPYTFGSLFHCSNGRHILEPWAAQNTALNLGSAKLTDIQKSAPTIIKYKYYNNTQPFTKVLSSPLCTIYRSLITGKEKSENKGRTKEGRIKEELRKNLAQWKTNVYCILCTIQWWD